MPLCVFVCVQDVLVTPLAAGQARVLLTNNGSGVLSASGLALGVDPSASVLVDVNHNGRLDVAAAGVLDPYPVPAGLYVLGFSPLSMRVVHGLFWAGGGWCVEPCLSWVPPVCDLCVRNCACTVQPVTTIRAGYTVTLVRLVGRSGALNQHGATVCAAPSTGGGRSVCRVVDAGGGARSQVGCLHCHAVLDS